MVLVVVGPALVPGNARLFGRFCEIAIVRHFLILFAQLGRSGSPRGTKYVSEGLTESCFCICNGSGALGIDTDGASEEQVYTFPNRIARLTL